MVFLGSNLVVLQTEVSLHMGLSHVRPIEAVLSTGYQFHDFVVPIIVQHMRYEASDILTPLYPLHRLTNSQSSLESIHNGFVPFYHLQALVTHTPDALTPLIFQRSPFLKLFLVQGEDLSS